MTYEVYRYIFIGGAILSGIMLLVSVLVFFMLKIPTVIGDLTGSNARKAIENIRNSSKDTLDKTGKPANRGSITDKISPSGRITERRAANLDEGPSTVRLNPKRVTASETTVLDQSPANSASETTVLNQSSVTVSSDTTVLSQNSTNGTFETTVLDAQPTSSLFVIEYEITYIHTNEVIA